VWNVLEDTNLKILWYDIFIKVHGFENDKLLLYIRTSAVKYMNNSNNNHWLN